MLAHAHGFTLVDYETAHFGDPTMDLGFFLSHLLLKAVAAAGDRRPFFELTRAFWRGYAGRGRVSRRWRSWKRAASAICGVCLLARIDGTSPVDYLPEEPKREAVRRLGRAPAAGAAGSAGKTCWPCVEAELASCWRRSA